MTACTSAGRLPSSAIDSSRVDLTAIPLMPPTPDLRLEAARHVLVDQPHVVAEGAQGLVEVLAPVGLVPEPTADGVVGATHRREELLARQDATQRGRWQGGGTALLLHPDQRVEHSALLDGGAREGVVLHPHQAARRLLAAGHISCSSLVSVGPRCPRGPTRAADAAACGRDALGPRAGDGPLARRGPARRLLGWAHDH